MSTSEQRRRTGRLPPIRCFEDEEEIVRDKARDCGQSWEGVPGQKWRGISSMS